MLADKMAAVPTRGGGGALFQNIQNGGRQSLSGGAQTLTSRPSVHAAVAARVRADSLQMMVGEMQSALSVVVVLSAEPQALRQEHYRFPLLLRIRFAPNPIRGKKYRLLWEGSSASGIAPKL